MADATVNKKPVLKSRTIWWNVLAGGLAVVNEFAGKIIPTEIATVVVGVGNIVLRFFTDKKLG